MTDSEFSIALRNYAGIPVVDLVGEINRNTLGKLEEILDRLVRAGHYNVMINLKRAACQNLTNLASLERIAKLFRSHHGSLDLVAEAEQIAGLVQRKSFSALFRLCTSEGQALTRIRKIPFPSASNVKSTPARFAEPRRRPAS